MKKPNIIRIENLEEMVEPGHLIHNYQFTGAKYCEGKIGEYLGQVFGKGLIPAADGYLAYKAGLPPESLVLAPGMLYIDAVYKVAKAFGNFFGVLGKYLHQQIPKELLDVTRCPFKKSPKELKEIVKQYEAQGFQDVKVKEFQEMLID